MKRIYTALVQRLIDKPEFLDDYQILFAAYIRKLVGDRLNDVPKELAVRLARVAQIFVASGEPENIEIGIRISQQIQNPIGRGEGRAGKNNQGRQAFQNTLSEFLQVLQKRHFPLQIVRIVFSHSRRPFVSPGSRIGIRLF